MQIRFFNRNPDSVNLNPQHCFSNTVRVFFRWYVLIEACFFNVQTRAGSHLLRAPWRRQARRGWAGQPGWPGRSGLLRPVGRAGTGGGGRRTGPAGRLSHAGQPAGIRGQWRCKGRVCPPTSVSDPVFIWYGSVSCILGWKPIRIQVQSFDDQKLEKIYSWKKKILLSKTTIYLSLGLHKGHPSYRKSLQPSKENIQQFKLQRTEIF